jgi:hypothetical protein
MDPMNSTSAPTQESYTAHATTISAAALAARVAALEKQVEACQQANTKLIARIVELEHGEAAAYALAMDVETKLMHLHAVCQRLADGAAQRSLSFVDILAALSEINVRPSEPRQEPPRAQEPARVCDHCGLPLVSSHLVDEVILTNGAQRVSVHRVCANAYTPDWQVVAWARGM